MDFYCAPWMATFDSSGIQHCFHDWHAMGNCLGVLYFNCQLDLHVLQGNRDGSAHRDNILNAQVIPHFDNHSLADRSIFTDDGTRPQRARIVGKF